MNQGKMNEALLISSSILGDDSKELMEYSKKITNEKDKQMETIEENVEFVYQYSQDAVDLSAQGKKAIDNITLQIDTIVTHSNQVADAVDKLSNQSSQILTYYNYCESDKFISFKRINRSCSCWRTRKRIFCCCR